MMNVAHTDIHTDVTVLRNTNEGVRPHGGQPPWHPTPFT